MEEKRHISFPVAMVDAPLDIDSDIVQEAASEALFGITPEKVSEKWFKQHGWETWEDNSVEEDGTIKRAVRCTLNDGKHHARYDRLVYIYPPRRKDEKKRISRFYMFYAHGKNNNFTVENRISHYNFTVAQIQAALKLVGFYEK